MRENKDQKNHEYGHSSRSVSGVWIIESNLKIFHNLRALGNDPGIYMPARPPQIDKSESLMQYLLCVLMEDSYINPFGPEVGKDKLSSFSSRVTLGNEAIDFLLSSVGFGKQRQHEFVEKILDSAKTPFNDLIKQVMVKISILL